MRARGQGQTNKRQISKGNRLADQTDTGVLDGGRRSVVRASEFKSEAPGFDPLAGQGEDRGSFSILPSQLLCRPDSLVGRTDIVHLPEINF